MFNPPAASRFAANAATAIVLTLATGELPPADAAAAQHGRPGIVRHGASFQHAAPFRGAPMQHMTPRWAADGRPVRTMPAFTPNHAGPPHANQQFHPDRFRADPNPPFRQDRFRADPNPQFHRPEGLRPNLPFNNPDALRNPSTPQNPSALRPNFPPGHQGWQDGQGSPGNGSAGNGLPGNYGRPGNGAGALTPPSPSFGNQDQMQQAAPPQGAAGTGTGAHPSLLAQPPVSPFPFGQSPVNQAPSNQTPAGQAPVSQPVVVNKPLLKPPPGGFPQTKPAFASVRRNGKFWPLHKDRMFTSFRGQRHAFAPASVLGVILLGGSYWYPDGYVAMDGPSCTGMTEDGCQLEWRMVDYEDGEGGEPQCVQYCPQAAASPDLPSPGLPSDLPSDLPPQAAALPPRPPLAPEGACQTTIYSEPNFTGNSAPTGDSQPVLASSGWRSEIASVVIAAGVWDFFADENFGGESLRLTPGTYPRLPPEWTRRIGSFMCVAPG